MLATDFADLVTRARESMRLNREEFAAAIGQGLRAVEGWEGAEHKPTRTALQWMRDKVLDAGLRDEIVQALAEYRWHSGRTKADVSFDEVARFLSRDERELISELAAKQKQKSLARYYASLIKSGLFAAISQRTSKPSPTSNLDEMLALEIHNLRKENEADARAKGATSSSRSRSKGRPAKTA